MFVSKIQPKKRLGPRISEKKDDEPMRRVAEQLQRDSLSLAEGFDIQQKLDGRIQRSFKLFDKYPSLRESLGDQLVVLENYQILKNSF